MADFSIEILIDIPIEIPIDIPKKEQADLNFNKKNNDRHMSRKMDKRRKAWQLSFAGLKTGQEPEREENKDSNTSMRLNKFLSDAGVCSRREADRMVEEGRILVDGKPAVLGQKVSRSQEVLVDGKPVYSRDRKVVIAYNKPTGIVCTAEKREKDNIIDAISYPLRVYPVGRLDKDSEGLIFLTNDGDLMNEILKAANHHEKEYIVKVNRPVTNQFLKRMSQGVDIGDAVTAPCKAEKIGLKSFRIILTQGLNRQIRRMCQALDYRVTGLRRVRIMHVRIGDLPTGQYREIRGEELYELYHRTGVNPPIRLPYEAPKKDQPVLNA